MKPVPQNQTAKHEEIWQKLVLDFRQVCILRRQGRIEESMQLLQKELPPKIAAWSEASPERIQEKRSILQTMFREEERKIEEAWLVHQLVANQWSAAILPSLCARVAEEIRDVLAAQMNLYFRIAGNPLSALASPGSDLERSGRGRGLMPGFGLRKQGGERISFDDVPGMIRALMEQEDVTRGESATASEKDPIPFDTKKWRCVRNSGQKNCKLQEQPTGA